MYHTFLFPLFQRYVEAKCKYELELWSFIEAVGKAEEGFGMKAMGFSHPYSYEEFLRLQARAGLVQNKWAVLEGIQKEIMEAMCVQITNIEPPQGVDGNSA